MLRQPLFPPKTITDFIYTMGLQVAQGIGGGLVCLLVDEWGRLPRIALFSKGGTVKHV